MRVRINDKWLVTSNANCLILNRITIEGEKSKNPGQENITEVGYFYNKQHLIKEIMKREFRSSAVTTLVKNMTMGEMLEFIGNFRAFLEEKLGNLFIDEYKNGM
ncbi:MAG: hypothetical protein ACTSX6_08225 [Candidatus Heimdallarchaeaceae archaeon]